VNKYLERPSKWLQQANDKANCFSLLLWLPVLLQGSSLFMFGPLDVLGIFIFWKKIESQYFSKWDIFCTGKLQLKAFNHGWPMCNI